VKALCLALLSCWSIQCIAVSRVGGGKIQSHFSGFELTITAPFDKLLDYQGGIVANGPNTFSPQLGIFRQFIEVSEFSSEFPDAIHLDKKSLTDRLSKSNWVENPSSISCAVELRQNHASVIAYLVTWGEGKGFVIKGPRSPQVETAMRAILASLKIENGACTWN
jgi:hypothetical protein